MSAQASPLNATRPANAAGTWRRREESKTTAFSPYRQKLQSPLLPDMRELTAKTLNGACMQAGSVAEFQPGLQKGATPGDTAGWAESAGLVSRRRFWRDCKWVQFLPPSREGFAAARQHPACTAGMPCSPSLAKCTFCSCEPAVLVVIPQRARAGKRLGLPCSEICTHLVHAPKSAVQTDGEGHHWIRCPGAHPQAPCSCLGPPAVTSLHSPLVPRPRGKMPLGGLVSAHRRGMKRN